MVVAEEVLPVTDRNESALVQHRQAIGDPLGALHGVRHDQHRHAEGTLQEQNQLVDAGRDDRIEPRRRLVEHENLGIERHGARDRRPLLHPARELMGQQCPGPGQSDGFQLQPNHQRDHRIGERGEFLQGQCDVLLDRQGIE
jgi:hypothetical protein